MKPNELTLDIATTTDILEELDRRGLAFVFIFHSQQPDNERRLCFGGVLDDWQALEICESAAGFLSTLVE